MLDEYAAVLDTAPRRAGAYLKSVAARRAQPTKADMWPLRSRGVETPS